MASTEFGTDIITGLNVGTAPHKIASHELQESYRGWTDQEGAWTTARGPEVQYAGYSDISCFAAGRMGGADHLVWMDGNTLYDNGSNVGTITAGDPMKIIAVDDMFLILGAAKNYLYDGNHVREQGCWQPEYIDRLYLQKAVYTAFGTAITGISKASPCVITQVAHKLETGDYVTLSGIGGMVELNDRSFLVTRITADTYSINDNSTDYTTFTTAGTYTRASLLEGVYKWYIACTVELADGTILQSRPRGLRLNSLGNIGTSVSLVSEWEAEPITMTSSDTVFIGQLTKLYGSISWIDDSVQRFSITGTIGTDYFPGLRIYRTMQDGTDFYLEREYRHGDANFVYITGGDAGYFLVHDGDENALGAVFGAPDIDLGAVYDVSATDHSNPPVSSVAASVGQRLFVNNTSETNQYHWSHLDGITYYNPLGWNTVPDAITVLANLGNVLVIGSQDRIWIDRFTGGAPDVSEVRTDVGIPPNTPHITTDDGLMFLREDGLWLFDGVRVVCISRRGFPDIDTPKSIAATGDTVYMSGLYESYVVRQRDSGMVWHGGDAAYPMSDSTGGSIYGASENAVSKLFIGSKRGGRFKTKDFAIGGEGQVAKVYLDIAGNSVPLVWVTGNRQSDNISHEGDDANAPNRRIIEVYVPLLSNHIVSISGEVTGDCTLYGISVEVQA